MLSDPAPICDQPQSHGGIATETERSQRSIVLTVPKPEACVLNLFQKAFCVLCASVAKLSVALWLTPLGAYHGRERADHPRHHRAVAAAGLHRDRLDRGRSRTRRFAPGRGFVAGRTPRRGDLDDAEVRPPRPATGWRQGRDHRRPRRVTRREAAAARRVCGGRSHAAAHPSVRARCGHRHDGRGSARDDAGHRRARRSARVARQSLGRAHGAVVPGRGARAPGAPRRRVEGVPRRNRRIRQGRHGAGATACRARRDGGGDFHVARRGLPARRARSRSAPRSGRRRRQPRRRGRTGGDGPGAAARTAGRSAVSVRPLPQHPHWQRRPDRRDDDRRGRQRPGEPGSRTHSAGARRAVRRRRLSATAAACSAARSSLQAWRCLASAH